MLAPWSEQNSSHSSQQSGQLPGILLKHPVKNRRLVQIRQLDGLSPIRHHLPNCHNGQREIFRGRIYDPEIGQRSKGQRDGKEEIDRKGAQEGEHHGLPLFPHRLPVGGQEHGNTRSSAAAQ